MKNFQVLIKAYAAVVVIEAENEEKAVELALEDVSFGDFEMDEAVVEREIKTEQELASAKRHAQHVCKLE